MDKFDVNIITLNPELHDSRIIDFSELGIDIIQSQVRSRRNIIGILKHVKSSVKFLQPDIIHTQGIRPDLVSGFFLSHYKRISTLRAFLEQDYGMQFSNILSKILVKIHIKAYSRLEVIVTVSDSVQRNLRKILKHKRIKTVENSFQNTLRNSTDCDPLHLVERFNPKGDKTVFIVSGGLIKRKDPCWLINFWKKSFKDDDRKVLLFVGEGPLMEECVRLAKDANNISLLGHVDNVLDYYLASDVFLSCSHAEGLPNAVLEALSTNMKCILSSIEPHRELAMKVPENISLYNLSDEKSLLDKIHAVINKNSFTNKKMDNMTSKRFSQQLGWHEITNIFTISSFMNNTRYIRITRCLFFLLKHEAFKICCRT